MGKTVTSTKVMLHGDSFPKQLQDNIVPILYSKYMSKPSLTWSRSLFPLFCFSKPSCSICENCPTQNLFQHNGLHACTSGWQGCGSHWSRPYIGPHLQGCLGMFGPLIGQICDQFIQWVPQND